LSNKTAVVVGGGIAGLASAALLAKAGMKVQLFEANATLGGRADVWEKDGFRFDMGPSWYLMPDAFEQFFKLMGTSAKEQLDLVRLNPAYQTRNEGLGDALLMPDNVEGIKELFESIETGPAKACRDIWTAQRMPTIFRSSTFVHKLPRCQKLRTARGNCETWPIHEATTKAALFTLR